MPEQFQKPKETPEETKTRFLLEHIPKTPEEWEDYQNQRANAILRGETVWISDGQPKPRYSCFSAGKRRYYVEQGLGGTWGAYFEVEDSLRAGMDVIPGVARVTLGEAVQAVEAALYPPSPEQV